MLLTIVNKSRSDRRVKSVEGQVEIPAGMTMTVNVHRDEVENVASKDYFTVTNEDGTHPMWTETKR